MTSFQEACGGRNMPQLKPSFVQVVPGLWSWSVFSEEKQMNFNGYTVQLPSGLAIIDPPSATPKILSDIGSLAQPSVIILSNRDHERESLLFREYFSIPVAIHAFDAPLLTFAPEIQLSDRQLFLDAIEIIHLPNQKSPGESALYFKAMGVLILGDALIGKPSGQLNLLPVDKYQDIAIARQSLKKLLTLDFEYLLLGDGESILSNAHAVLEAFFSDACGA
jgi:glyoxylase-like metal-dependent hydrolase (beta-lactamase superfamily II)